MGKTDYDKAYEWYKHNYNSLPIEERKGLTDLFTRLSEVGNLILMQYDILTRFKIRQETLVEEVIKWYRENNTSKNEQDI